MPRNRDSIYASSRERLIWWETLKGMPAAWWLAVIVLVLIVIGCLWTITLPPTYTIRREYRVSTDTYVYEVYRDNRYQGYDFTLEGARQKLLKLRAADGGVVETVR